VARIHRGGRPVCLFGADRVRSKNAVDRKDAASPRARTTLADMTKTIESTATKYQGLPSLLQTTGSAKTADAPAVSKSG
jgi:hypothetical protein